jgi:hypothetical protein
MADKKTITASAGTGGAISPSGATLVNSGDDQTFTAAAIVGYTINEWTVDGEVVHAGGLSHTLNNVVADQTISVTFTILAADNIEEAICSAIIADTDLHALIADRIYLQELPQKGLLPAITYQRIDTEFHHTLADTIKLRKPVFQFNIWAATIAEVIAIIPVLETCLTGMKGIWDNIKVENVKPIDEGDLVELEPNEELKRRGRRIDYEFWIQEIA